MHCDLLFKGLIPLQCTVLTCEQTGYCCNALRLPEHRPDAVAMIIYTDKLLQQKGCVAQHYYEQTGCCCDALRLPKHSPDAVAMDFTQIYCCCNALQSTTQGPSSCNTSTTKDLVPLQCTVHT